MSYVLEWIPGGLLALPVLLVAPPLAMVAVLILLLVAVALIVALAGTIAAAPYLLLRSVRSHRAQHVPDRRTVEPMRRRLEPVPSKQI